MVRTLRLLFLFAIGIVLLTVALANRAPVTLRLLPEETGVFFGIDWTVDLPLFLVIFGGIVAGLLIGFVWEWLREAKHRAEASRRRGEVARLDREVSALKGKVGAPPEDEVLALVDGGARKRA